jgi:GntR family transcriptional repressor for pyruvate dehydrogenase complex
MDDERLFGMGTLRLPKTADVVAARVRTTILARQLPAGTPLPNEREMIEHFKVSRASIREALRILEAEGVIEVRRGMHGGVFTAEPTGRLLARGLAGLLAHRRTPVSDLIEIRLLLEPEAAALAARNASSEQRQRLVDFAHRAQPDVMPDHVDFHLMVAECSGNGVMTLFLAALRDIVAEAATFADLPRNALEQGIKAHQQIALAIAAGDEAKARRATVRHLQSYAADLVTKKDMSAPIISLAQEDELLPVRTP